MDTHVAKMLDLREVLGDVPSKQTLNHDQTEQNPLDWNMLLTPHLRTLLNASEYDSRQVDWHCEFFERNVIPWLGPSPTKLSSTGVPYPRSPIPRLTKDGTPLEFSLTWKGSETDQTLGIRYVVEIATREFEPLRCANLIHAMNALEAFDLAAVSQNSPLQVVVFKDVWNAVTIQMLEFDKLKHCNKSCLHCGASAMYFGFDLEPSRIKLKPYWHLPVCATTEELLRLMDSVICVCQPLDAFYSSQKFLEEWQDVRNQIATRRYESYCRPVLLSMDATKAPNQRFKFYARCIFDGSIDFEQWGRHMDIPGQISTDTSFKQSFSKLWEELCRPEPAWTAEQRQTKPNFVGIQYDLQPDSDIQSRIYIMCPEIARPDNYLSQVLLKHLGILRKARVIHAMASLSEPTEFITVIAARSRGENMDFTLYFTPAIFARGEWKERCSSEGYLTKVRNKTFASTGLA